MTFFRKTSSTRFWIRLQRHPSGHYEALLSGLTCQDVYDCLKEQFDGKYLVLFSLPDAIMGGGLFSDTPAAEYTAVGEGARNPCYVIAPPSVQKVLRAEAMNQNDQWWFFPYPKPITHEELRALELTPHLGYFRSKPGQVPDFFVACVQDLTAFTKDRACVERLIQKLFAKYCEGLELLSPEETAQVDFVREMEIDLAALERSKSAQVQAAFRLLPGPVARIFKDIPRSWRRIGYQYSPDAGGFERVGERTLNLATLLAENWGTIAVSFSSFFLTAGTVIIVAAIITLILVFVVISFM